MRHQMRRTVVTVAGVAAALAVCAGPAAAVAQTGSSPAAASVASPALGAGISFPADRGPAAADATGRTGCVTILNLGPRAAAGAGFRTLSRSGTSYRLPAAGSGGRAVWQVTRRGLTRLRPGAAGAGPAEVRPASAPGARTYTVMVTGTNIAGQPVGGRNADVFLINADDPARSASVARFAHGVAKFRVPAGRYWALADFIRPLPGQHSRDEYLDVLPPFPVAREPRCTPPPAPPAAVSGRCCPGRRPSSS
jgi:hypothetical protein